MQGSESGPKIIETCSTESFWRRSRLIKKVTLALISLGEV
jgi:hypothetical protein